MRIAIITESFPPDVNGVAHSVVRVAENLMARGHEPLVIAPQPSSAARSVAGVFPYPVVRVPSVPTPGYGAFRLGLPSPRIAAALRSHGTELVHLASPFFLGARGMTVASSLDLPAVAVYQTDVPSYARTYYRVGLGERRGEQLARIFASLDVFAHTGPYETFGQTVQEALASGVPVVAPAAGGPLDLVDDGRTGFLVPPCDAGALAHALAGLAASPE